MSLGRWLRKLTTPSPEIRDVAERRRARILATMLLAISPLGLASIIVQLIVTPNFLPTFIASGTAIAILFGLGLLARTRYYPQAALASTVAIVIACAASGLSRPDDQVWWAYCMIAVLVATLLVSLRSAIAIALFAFAAVLVVGEYHGKALGDLSAPLMFHVVFSPLLLVVAHYRNRIEEARRGELITNQRQLEHAARIARIGHFRIDGEAWSMSKSLRELLELGAADPGRDDLLAGFEPRSAVEGLLAVRSGQVDCQWRGDKLAHVSVSVEVTREDGRDILLGTVQDITERVQAEARREQSYESQRMETIGRIAGGIAHDFNNLLTVVGSSAELARDAAPADRAANLDDIRTATRRGALLVRQLLAYARKQVLEQQDLELASLVDELRPILERLAGKDVLRVRATADGPLRVRADRSQLEQVLVNLVVNAKDAICEGGTIELRTGAVNTGPAGTPLEDTPCAYIVVVDDGAGMTDDVRRRIFEPFFTTKQERGGSGLGLATAYGIVMQSGGRIEVESAVGEGTTFRVYLPLARAPIEVAPRRPSGELRGKVLVVDDEPIVLHTTTRMLEQAGYETLAANGPDEARAIWRDHQAEIGLVLSDVMMPGTDGPALIRELLGERDDVRAVLMSGFSGETIGKYDLSNLPLLEKPFSRETLLRTISGDAPATRVVIASDDKPETGLER